MNRKKSIWIRLAAASLAVCTLILTIPTEAQAKVYWPEGPKIYTPSAIVMEVNTGTVLYEKKADQVNYPASITKILTTLITLENSELDEEVTFSADAVYKNEGDTSHIARDLGEVMTMEECLYAVMLASANECAYAVAEHVGQKQGGDFQTFIDMMNDRAKALGCKNTHFNNSNGLPDKDHWTSARDMALISAEAYKNETFRIIAGTTKYQIPPTNKHKEITYLANHHKMLHAYNSAEWVYEGCKGGKTGYTDVAGNTLVTFAERDGITLVCVVMHTDRAHQYADTIELFDYCFQHFQAVSITDKDGDVATGNKGIMNNNESFIEVADNSYVILPVTASISDVKSKVINKNLPEGVIAQLQYKYDGRTVGCVDIVPSGVTIKDSYFDYANDKNENKELKVIKIKPLSVFLVLLAVAAAIVLVFFGKRLYDNYYVIIHDMQVRRERRARFRPIEKKRRRRRKKDSMFR